jgi:CubicO group peptidase (beta-lactamase class C family)
MIKFFKIVIWIFAGIIGLLIVSFLVLKFIIIPLNAIRPGVFQLTTTEYFNQNLIDSFSKHMISDMPNKSSMAIGIVDNGEVHYYGIKRENDTFYTIQNRNWVYGIGSISKVFTSTIFANMILRNEIDTSKSVDTYFGYKFKDELKLSPISLSNHTSGLSRMPDGSTMKMLQHIDNPYIDYTDDWLKNYLQKEVTINKDSIGKYEYSNLGIGILGNTLCSIKKNNFDEMIKEYVTQKYEMKNTFVYSEKIKSRVVIPYDGEDEATIWNLQSMIYAGSVFSSVEDMGKFALANMDSTNKEFQLMQLPSVKVDDVMSLGIGWHIIKSKINHKVLFHNGAIGIDGGYTASMSIDMDTRKSVIILSSMSMTNPSVLDQFNFSILRYLNK